ncbi:proton-conducting membrane transporter [Paraburkholderia sp. MMS20-SJTR3]|uniref:Proton-conducting membrane transporter n=1 Tax=Paraburkholderia sejongensis TaxID=2886946 RepID=A0ABS8K5V0_9BURK|nr:proton-conducting transporter membrane subunit [Paraburkholderia sp. MMS20-SJTR3]MCC8397523.1 proton-conducting membrane transporter [Paraburkholderia sp. MMS20-SJTR3]
MVAALFHPLHIFILGLGGGFVIPLLYRLGKPWLTLGFFVALAGIVLVSGVSFYGLIAGGDTIEVLTAGALPPVSINLRFGPWEAFFTFSVNVVALLGALHLWDRLRGNYAALLLYLILVMGIDGMVMTRDLFNLFVFLEIVSIATYGLFGLERKPAALAAGFKYIIATVIASTFFLLGAVLLYYVSGTLNIDQLLSMRGELGGPIGTTAVLLVFASLVIELKPFPANGWGLDVYETMPSGVAAMVSVGVSAGVFFALLKLLPLFDGQLTLLAVSGGATFLFSNLLALKQSKPQRVLGYSSIGQMALLMLALALLRQIGAEVAIPLVVGGLFINHLFAKAGLFWLAGVVQRYHRDPRAVLARNPLLIGLLGLFMVAIAGLPPFPGFWAKWELVMRLTAAGKPYWIVLILTGSLLEAGYMFRWFVRALRPSSREAHARPDVFALLPLLGVALLLIAAGYLAALISGVASLWIFSPLLAGALFYAADRLPGRAKGVLALLAIALIGALLAAGTSGIAGLFAWLLLAGSLVITAASLYRDDPREGFYPMLVVLALSIPALLRSTTTLEFFYSWEIITLSSCFLIAKCRRAGPHVLTFLLFSLLSAFFLLAGFASVAAIDGSIQLAALIHAGPEANRAFVLLAAGFLIKAGAIGVHVWLPGAYTEAEDDVTAMLSSVVSKVAVFGLLVGTYLTIRSEVGLELAHAMTWIGMLTTLAGALMALRQNDFKRLLALSSMSQIGYIVTAIGLMSHLGWVTALYLVANHMLVKGILFLALAGVILRTGTRNFADVGGLAREMPFTFAMVVIALVSMSGLPPLMGFGGKWLLLSAMTDKGWYGVAICGLIATCAGFLYMTRFVNGIFLQPWPPQREPVREAPLALLVPQFLLVLGILILSFFPKLLIEPVSAAIDPQFAKTLVWGGMSLESIYGFWNPTPVVIVVLIVAALVFGLGVWYYRSRRGNAADAPDFYHFYRPMLSRTVPPFAQMFWRGASHFALLAAARIRRVYSGNGQTYALYVLLYFLAIYFLSTGLGTVSTG